MYSPGSKSLTVIEDPTALSRIVYRGATTVPRRVRGIAADGAGDHSQRRVARVGAAVIDTAATGAGDVTADSAGKYCQCRAAGSGSIVVDTATQIGRVAADVAVTDHQRRMIIIDTATGVDCGTTGGRAVGNGQAGDRNGHGVGDVKDTAGGVTINGQIDWAGAEDDDAVRHDQFATGQQDGARDAGKVNCIAVRYKLSLV